MTTTMDLDVDAYIPDSYIPNEYQKLDIYKRIAAIESQEEVEDMKDELLDRFGDIPRKVEYAAGDLSSQSPGPQRLCDGCGAKRGDL